MHSIDWFLPKKIAGQVAVGVSHAATSCVNCENQNLLLLSLQLVTEFFVAKLVANMHAVSREQVFLVTCNMAVGSRGARGAAAPLFAGSRGPSPP